MTDACGSPIVDDMGQRKLITAEIAKTIPALYATDGIPEGKRKVPVKFFDPCGRGTWYVLEYDGEDMLFCYVKSPITPEYDELGYVSLDELSGVRNGLGLKLERDEHWDASTTLAAVRAGA